MTRPIRTAVRAIIMRDNKLLLVNAYKGRDHLWCAPGGGANLHSSLPDNLIREVHEETGLRVSVHDPCLINEFHNPRSDFHQVDIYFRCSIISGETRSDWVDPERVVSKRIWVDQVNSSGLRIKPDSLMKVAWNTQSGLVYDPLEPIVR